MILTKKNLLKVFLREFSDLPVKPKKFIKIFEVYPENKIRKLLNELVEDKELIKCEYFTDYNKKKINYRINRKNYNKQHLIYLFEASQQYRENNVRKHYNKVEKILKDRVNVKKEHKKAGVDCEKCGGEMFSVIMGDESWNKCHDCGEVSE